ncbi:MAG: M1 family metallopeptidase, partial [Chthoniobacteraceae bacterium]
MNVFFRLITLAILLATSRAEEPFAFARTPGKLPKSIVPLRYAIRIEPSIEKAALRGSETIEIEVREAVREVVLNSLALEIDKATLTGAKPIALTPKLDVEKQTLTFALAEELPPGKYTLALEYHGKLTEQTEGLYLTRYQVGAAEKFALTTQFEATDARRMFPCWDEPVFRAAFQLTAVVPEKHTAISNMPAERETKLAEGLKEVVFAPSPSMVSYLVAFSAGEFDVLRDEVDGIQLGVYFTEGKREMARYAMEATKKIVPYFNEYFGVKYPLPKLDQISFANTAAGGMENWGCIIYSDTAFLFDPKTSSHSAKERAFEVIAHEVAHQWFGDLVTMAWWDNLWLNEGFASWMGTKATDHFNSDWNIWTRAAGDKEHAMALDARATTHPIQQPVETEAQAGDAFDEITYQKGQSFIRMLESYLGEEKFREGIRSYMSRHKFGNTTTADLWIALAEVSGKPVREFAAGWTEQPGFPVVKIDATPDGDAVSLTQERFTLNQKDPKPLTWRIPLLIGQSRLVEIGADPVRFSRTAGAVIKANTGGVGYFRVQYNAGFAALVQQAHTLSEADRLNLLCDTWALVQAARVEAAAYLGLVAKLAGDDSFAIVAQIAGRLEFIDGLSRGRTERGEFREWARGLLQPQLDKLGWDARPGEMPLDDLRRNTVIHTLGALGDEAVLREGRTRFARYIEKPATLTGEQRDNVWWLAGRAADEKIYAQLHDAAKKTDSVEQKRSLYGALAAAPDPALIQKTLAIALTNELPPQHAARIVQRVAGGSEHPELALEYAQKHITELVAKLSSFRANDYIADVFENFTD